MTKREACVVLVAAAAFVAANTPLAADTTAGKAKATEVCASCHGPDGNSTSQDFPKLAGQYPDYLDKAMRDYKSGDRKNPIMAGFAKQLSNQDIENLAAYYGSQPPAVSSKH